ncbi:hypothetical protein [Citreimonas salinaria]|uniref:Glycosyl transferase family 2 n=1 Tax=Citreimonas salinaria TaxID=321339 RepID=A0A1H3J7V5_9RHOB|nr:hypothetical protein [Citreimonas salinaria]SDY35639.1 hypothetical protein SAMN05444340_10689 [Citreimonas salinaria]
MHYPDVETFARRGLRGLPPGPVALIFAEDSAALDATLRHHQRHGLTVVLLGAPDLAVAEDLSDLPRVDLDAAEPDAVLRAVSRIADAAPGRWFYWGYNAEFLFYPFAETRRVGEMLSFHAQERREAMLTYVIDLYAGDLGRHPDAVALDDAWLDRMGYYAAARIDPATAKPRERQLDIHGGLRWRFEEHVPPDRRRIDRIALFRARRGLTLRPDHTLSVEEMNTYACPWHNSLTAAVMSFRAAKALRFNPDSREAIDTFRWRNSVPFQWHSRQLLDLGFIEPGQWF